MFEETITIDVDELRRDLQEDSLGAFYGGGFGGAFMEAGAVDWASDEEVIEMAQSRGFDLWDYQV